MTYRKYKQQDIGQECRRTVLIARIRKSLCTIGFVFGFAYSLALHAVIVSPDLEVITISNVDGTPQTINLQNTYTSAIPVCTYNIASSTPVPVVVRIDNIVDAGTQPVDHSFDVYLQKASNDATAIDANDVHCVISDVGEYTVGGLHWEARTDLSTVTARQSNFNVDASDKVDGLITGSFSSAVVLHQVITSNDAGWSASWTHGGASGNPPTASTIYVGKHVGADSDITRVDETVGFIVIEQGSGTENGVSYDAALGADTIDGVDTDGNSYTAPTIDYRHGIASQNAMDGGDGGWAVLFGAAPLAGSAIDVAIDEDDIGDAERNHTTEQVAYWLFEPVNVADLEVSIDDGSATYTPGTDSVYTVTVTNNGPNDASSVNVLYGAPAGTTISGWTCAGASCPDASGSGDINETAATLVNGDTLVYSVTVAVPSSQTGNLVNTVTVSNANVDPIAANDSASDTDTQASSTDIAVTNDDGSASYTPGTTVQYTVTVGNTGPSDAASVAVTNNAPAGTSITGWTCAGADCPNASGAGDITETITSLASGDNVVYTVDVAVPSSQTGNLVSTASVAAATDGNAANDSAIDTDTQSSSADIAVTNDDGSPAYLPGSTVVYNLTVSNNGPSDASNVSVTNNPPAGATISSWSCSGAACPNPAGAGAISENVPALVSGDSVSYVVNVSVPFLFVGNLVNTASASATEPDPVGANNSATDIDVASPDTDGDGVPDSIELSDGTDPNDPTDFRDSDGDGVPDLVENAEGTDPNDPASILDSDGDGDTDYIERGGDKDGDGIGDEFESSITDTDGNNIADDLDTDADGDGVDDTTEGAGDTDGDGIPDFLDRVTGGNPQGGDSDGDGIVDASECVAYPACAETDGDRIPNYADNNDDGDSLLTSAELGSGGGVSPDDSDSDTVFDYLEPNEIDLDGDGMYNHLDADDDGDGIATIDELDANDDLSGDALSPDDLDNEGIPDYLDASNGDGTGTDITGSGDSDNDGISDAEECPDAPMCVDSDGDGIPDYMIGNTDSDGDGILDAVEIGPDPANPLDADADGVPDYLENDSLDTDGDGINNPLDSDDDGDGIPTIDELGAGGAADPADTDGDGTPDYLSVTRVQTGLGGGAGSSDSLLLFSLIVMLLLRVSSRQSIHGKNR